MKKIKLCLLATLVAVALTGCSTTNLAKVLHELKSDPATVDFEVMAPGWAVKFARSWPTNLNARFPSTVQFAPGYIPPAQR